ncbi:helix-turn-helix domain-containing protein [Streptomyces lancefieldiae]|uniref:MerR family transcriptional regulator n=1 Tax=Streptomyces lancefieldiae TaxID=3075520 RepID=A0ABU3ALW5_9ACTN|nr:MerR family transcriptional regulator [Streptomyces sp. DSM 40712]MDT0611183.1 MerR family transcriptional regulator [Streptomyces sp. DSM 40712]
MFTSYDGLCGIGELAEQAGVTVKTVRFYSDRGLLPETSRSAGGHRRYGPGALDRLRLIRSLRGLGLSVPEVRRILDEEDEAGEAEAAGGAGAAGSGALEAAVAGRLRELGSELKALRWREAALRLVHECPPGERAGRLRLIGAVPAPPSTDPLVRFWRGWLPARMPARAVGGFLEAAVPQPPDDPVPAQVLAFARLNALTLAPCRGTVQPQPEAHRAAGARGAAVLYAGLAGAYELAGVPLRGGRDPQPGEALDGFVAAYTSAYGVRDTPDFRRVLAGQLSADPRLDGYWELVAEVITPPGGRPEPTPGSAHDWLLAALVAETGDAPAHAEQPSGHVAPPVEAPGIAGPRAVRGAAARPVATQRRRQ